MDSGSGSEEEFVARLWDHCRSIIWATDRNQRHWHAVFLDEFLSTAPFFQRFLDIREICQITTDLRASSCFELFGFGSPGKVSAAILQETLASWYFRHRRTMFSPSLAAHSFDPPLREKRRPDHRFTTVKLTSAAATGAAAVGPPTWIAGLDRHGE